MEIKNVIQFENEFIDYLRKNKVSNDSVRSYISYLTAVSQYLSLIIGPQNIATEADISTISKDLQALDRLSNKTISNYVSALRQYIQMVSSSELNKWGVRSWKEVVIIIEPSGKAPKKYGENVYRFSANLTLSVLMPRRGWDIIKNTKNYVYLKPPSNVLGPPFEISVKIPDRSQAIRIAEKCYEEAESWMGQIGEWPAWYTHERTTQMMRITPAREESDKKRELLPPSEPVSSLQIGEYGVWQVVLKKTAGDFDYRESVLEKEENTENELLEGSQVDVVQTKYERNLEARRKCIDFYGAKCFACRFDFSEVYGPIGEGFIHVHHIVPISSLGKEYEVNPIKDLVPLCPNCHAMAHRRNPPYTVEELQQMRKRQKFNA